MRTLILTDNPLACELAGELCDLYGGIDVFQSPNGPLDGVPQLNVRDQMRWIAVTYDVVISIHCKQLFPAGLVKAVRCVNVHPGLNPHNRGWYPQVFSILNGLPSGVTIHEMDEELDHGPVIVQEPYTIQPWDTSGTAYATVMKLERDLVLKHFQSIRDGTYTAVPGKIEGNVNYRRDFDRLREIDLNQEGTFREFIDRLRALTHDDLRNAYFRDASGRKVFIRVLLEVDETAASEQQGANGGAKAA